MSTAPDKDSKPLSEITFRLHAGAVLSMEELEKFRSAAQTANETPDERMVRLIREDNERNAAA